MTWWFVSHVEDDLEHNRALSAHKAQCKANKALIADIHHQQQHKKSKKRKRTSSSCSPEGANSGATRFTTPIETEVADFQLEELQAHHFPSPLPAPIVLGHSGWCIHLPARHINYLPNELTDLQHAPLVPIPLSSAFQARPSQPPNQPPGSMGLFHIYLNHPTFTPPMDAILFNCIDASMLI
ncbi:hypothetical protein J3R82DRAFT_2724 [Butyriboletus roseoflavus]|nr:hypothetical protein J3R82DRAFT_2724 [Butyriboletus roseoflavus]